MLVSKVKTSVVIQLFLLLSQVQQQLFQEAMISTLKIIILIHDTIQIRLKISVFVYLNIILKEDQRKSRLYIGIDHSETLSI